MVREPQRILVMRFSALGDVLLATPVVRALKNRFPMAEIDWLLETPYLPLIEGNPYVKAVEYDKRGVHSGWAGLQNLRKTIKNTSYDLIIDLQNKPKTWWLRSAGRSSLAYSKRTTSQALLALLGYDPPMVTGHAIDRFMQALHSLNLESTSKELDLVITPRMAREAEGLFSRLRQPVAGIAPGARWATKRWPAQRFARLLEKLVDWGYAPVLLGGPSDTETIEVVRSFLRPELLASRVPDTTKMGVGGLAAVIAKSALVVAGDSGPVHIASATGTPVVALFGPTSPERWGPLSSKSAVVCAQVECSPCSNHGSDRCLKQTNECLENIEVDEVLAAIKGVHSNRGGFLRP